MKNAVLTIEYNPETDETKVSGPINNKGLCYGMLGKARDVVQNYEPGKVQQAKPGDANRIMGAGNNGRH